MGHFDGFQALDISIHAPREGSDLGLKLQSRRKSKISIHAPREGSDLKRVRKLFHQLGFLSTLPVRGATCTAFQMARFT